MERRQPYTEVPYQPATGDPVPGSPTSDMHHIAESISHRTTDSAGHRVTESTTHRVTGVHPSARYVGESGETASFSAAHAQAVAEEKHAVAEEKKEERRDVWYKGATMVKRIIGIVVVVIAVVAFYYWYKGHKAAQDAANGEIYSNDLTPGSVSRSGETSRAVAKPIGTNAGSPSANGGLTMPASDSLPVNAPNGAAFVGTGKFQVYRQGNITWRVNTETGESCILFATEDEWRKPIVFNHGCQAS